MGEFICITDIVNKCCIENGAKIKDFLKYGNNHYFRIEKDSEEFNIEVSGLKSAIIEIKMKSLSKYKEDNVLQTLNRINIRHHNIKMFYSEYGEIVSYGYIYTGNRENLSKWIRSVLFNMLCVMPQACKNLTKDPKWI